MNIDLLELMVCPETGARLRLSYVVDSCGASDGVVLTTAYGRFTYPSGGALFFVFYRLSCFTTPNTGIRKSVLLTPAANMLQRSAGGRCLCWPVSKSALAKVLVATPAQTSAQ